MGRKKKQEPLLRVRPDDARVHCDFGGALTGCGQFDEAIARCRKALEIRPDYAVAHTNLGNALAIRGQLDAAIGHYRKALDIKPDCVEALTNMAWIRATHADSKFRDARQALSLARRALELSSSDASVATSKIICLVV